MPNESRESRRFVPGFRSYMIAGMGVFGALSIAAFSKANQKPHFQEIDVERINIVEPNGTLRMTLSDAARSPGWVIGGKLIPGRPKTAGMIFYNDEGFEDGGLIFGGKKDKDGKYSAFGHLSFDQYNQDQVINLEYSEENGIRKQGLGINDQPEMPLAEMMPKYQAAMKMPAGPARDSILRVISKGSAQRVFLGRARDKSAIVQLSDAHSHPRLRLTVDSAGAASIEFLDDSGHVSRRISGSDTGKP
jgi:hypothetical protein